MKKFLIAKAVVCFIFLMMISSGILAGGYQISLHGNKQIGMGLIGTSLCMDASSGFYNPGGLALMPHNFSVLAGGSGIFSSTVFQMPQPSVYQTSTDNPVGTPFYFYAAGKITKRLAAGISINTPYGNGLAWEQNWAGKYLIQKINMFTISAQPTLSFRIFDFLSVGAGLVYSFGNVDLTRALPLQSPMGEGQVNINGSASGFGFNAGLLFSNKNGFNAGISYRSQIDMNVDDAESSFNVPSSLSPLFPTPNNVSVSLPLPANLDFGLSIQINPEVMIGMNLNYVFWSAYDSLSFDFANNTPAVTDSSSPREYSDRVIIRLGGEYRVNNYLFVRAGSYYDPSPVNKMYFTPETPSLDNLAFTTGLSFYPDNNFSVDFSLLYIMGLEKEVSYSPDNFRGTYKSRALIPGIGITYNY